MEFNFNPNIYEQHRGLVKCSPDSKYICMCVGNRIIIRDSATCDIDVIHSVVDSQISSIEWSPDSNFLMVCMYSRACIQVFSIQDKLWSCRINEGCMGIVSALWCPDSRSIVSFSDFHLTMVVWNISNTNQVLELKRPKSAPGCITFSTSGNLAAVVTRVDCKDYIHILSIGGSGDRTITNSRDENLQQRNGIWRSIRSFPVDSSILDTTSIYFTPDNSGIVIMDCALMYNVIVMDINNGNIKCRISPYKDGLGARCLSFSPNGKVLAIGGYDESIRLVSTIYWDIICEFKHIHPSKLPYTNSKANNANSQKPTDDDLTKVTNNTNSLDEPMSDSTAMATATLKDDREPKCYVELANGTFEINNLPNSLPKLPYNPSKPNTKHGIHQIDWCPSSKFIYSRNESQPNICWIWSIESLTLSSLFITHSPIKCLSWSPNCILSRKSNEEDRCTPIDMTSQLAITTGNDHIYFWSPINVFALSLPLPSISKSGHDNNNLNSEKNTKNKQKNSNGIIRLEKDKKKNILGNTSGEDLYQFGAINCKFSSDGSLLTITSKDKVCCCHLST